MRNGGRTKALGIVCLFLMAMLVLLETAGVRYDTEVKSRDVAHGAATREQIERAASQGDDRKLKELLANPHTGPHERWLALRHSASSGDVSSLWIVVLAGSDINHVEEGSGWNALHYGVLFGNPDVVAQLIALGCDPCHESGTGVTPLKLAQRRLKDLTYINFNDGLAECEAILSGAVIRSCN